MVGRSVTAWELSLPITHRLITFLIYKTTVAPGYITRFSNSAKSLKVMARSTKLSYFSLTKDEAINIPKNHLPQAIRGQMRYKTLHKLVAGLTDANEKRMAKNEELEEDLIEMKGDLQKVEDKVKASTIKITRL